MGRRGVIIRYSIGNTLFRIRTARNLSQIEVAKGICSQSMLSRIENDTSTPSIDKFFELLQRMNVSSSEFMYLQSLSKNNFHVQNQILDCIKELDIITLNILCKKHNISSEHLLSIDFMRWLGYCFNIKFPQVSISNNLQKIQKIIEQDEFYHSDFPLLAWGLPSLATNTILYTYKRWNTLFLEFPVQSMNDFLVVDITISLGCIQYKQHDYFHALETFQVGLAQAKKIGNNSRYIIICCILYCMTKEDTYKEQAKQLKDLFSKDIFYNYWYNIINQIFDEVKT